MTELSPQTQAVLNAIYGIKDPMLLLLGLLLGLLRMLLLLLACDSVICCCV